MKYLKRYTNAEQAVWREMGGAYGCWMKDKAGTKHYGYGELRETAMARAQYGVQVRGREANPLPLTHKEYADSLPLSRPCTCHDLNFGGECFNCGYIPQNT